MASPLRTITWPFSESTASDLDDNFQELFQELDSPFTAINADTVAFSKGTPVYLVGAVGGRPGVAQADASAATTLPAVGLMASVTAVDAQGEVQTEGEMTGIDTSSFTAGALLYVSETAGTLTSTAPALAQAVGVVLTVGTSGSILVSIGATGGANTLLDGTTHTDTSAGTVARGDLITGQGATPTWTRLAKGSAGQFVRGDGTDTKYSTMTVPDTIATGEVLYGSATNVVSALPVDTAGEVLQTQSTGNPPNWGPVNFATAASITGTLPFTNGGLGFSFISQGQIIYCSVPNTLSTLTKDTNATRYLANTGTSNNPKWDQVELTNGVSGILPVANGGTNLPDANGANLPGATASTEVTGMSGASVTASSLIPAGVFLIGVTVRVTTLITGATSFTIGDGSDVDRWGTGIAVAAGTTTTIADFTADGFGQFVAANDVVLTATGSNFTAGAVRITAHYLSLTAATS